MKCVKCGHEVGNEIRCQWCAGKADTGDSCRESGMLCCPNCGSPHIAAVRKDYDPGCGCLGLLLFSWVGLLLGFLGGGEVEMVCGSCGARWPAGAPHKVRRSGGGCLLVLLIILMVVLIMAC